MSPPFYNVAGAMCILLHFPNFSESDSTRRAIHERAGKIRRDRFLFATPLVDGDAVHACSRKFLVGNRAVVLAWPQVRKIFIEQQLQSMLCLGMIAHDRRPPE